MKNFKFIWLFLTNKEFRSLLKETILYSFSVYRSVKVKGCVEVSLFLQYHRDILTPSEIEKMYSEPVFKLPPKTLIDILSTYSNDELDELKNGL